MSNSKPLWAGRFSETPDEALAAFGDSLRFDERLWEHDIAGSRAHAAMLGATGVISADDAAAIDAGLAQIAAELAEGSLVLGQGSASGEDVHMAIESELIARIGTAGARLHTGRSRNDQVALDMHLWSKAAAVSLMEAVAQTAGAILDRAKDELGTIMPGYTHLQAAQPVLLSHHLLSWFWSLTRDWKRLLAAYDAADCSPLGAAALAGTSYPLDRSMTAHTLGLSRVIPNSIDAVSDRDFVVDLVYACTMCQVHLSRICEELVLWSSAEFGFIEMDDAHATGSSIMPQKKNPDFAELVRGKTGRVVGSLVGLLTTLKGIPLAYDKDLQEDKEALFDAVDTLEGSLFAVAGMVRSLSFKRDKMRAACSRGYMLATDLADYLVGKGIAFREAHAMVGSLVARCVERDIGLEDLSLAELKQVCPAIEADVDSALDLDAAVARRITEGGTAPTAVKSQLALAQKELAAMNSGTSSRA